MNEVSSSEPRIEVYIETFCRSKKKLEFGCAYIPAVNGNNVGPGRGDGRITLPPMFPTTCLVGLFLIDIIQTIKRDMDIYTNDPNLSRIIRGEVENDSEGRLKEQIESKAREHSINLKFHQRGQKFSKEIEWLMQQEKILDKQRESGIHTLPLLQDGPPQ